MCPPYTSPSCHLLMFVLSIPLLNFTLCPQNTCPSYPLRICVRRKTRYFKSSCVSSVYLSDSCHLLMCVIMINLFHVNFFICVFRVTLLHAFFSFMYFGKLSSMLPSHLYFKNDTYSCHFLMCTFMIPLVHVTFSCVSSG